MVTSPDGGGVIIVGGRRKAVSQKKILELRAGSPWTSGVWQEVGKELSNARYDHVVIPVPESITNCQKVLSQNPARSKKTEKKLKKQRKISKEN